MPGTQVRMNYHNDVEAAVNKQINIELNASYIYLAMAMHFDRDDISLPGAAKWFRKQSDEEREHAMALMEFQNLRGGRVKFQNISKPDKEEWSSLLEAMEAALALERLNNECLLTLHSAATNHNDAHMSDFLEEKFLDEQVKSISEIAKMVTNLRRCGAGMGEYVFDKEHFE